MQLARRPCGPVEQPTAPRTPKAPLGEVETVADAAPDPSVGDEAAGVDVSNAALGGPGLRRAGPRVVGERRSTTVCAGRSTGGGPAGHVVLATAPSQTLERPCRRETAIAGSNRNMTSAEATRSSGIRWRRAAAWAGQAHGGASLTIAIPRGQLLRSGRTARRRAWPAWPAMSRHTRTTAGSSRYSARLSGLTRRLARSAPRGRAPAIAFKKLTPGEDPARKNLTSEAPAFHGRADLCGGARPREHKGSPGARQSAMTSRSVPGETTN